MSDLPSGWEWATLGELGAYLNGRGFRKSEWRDTGRPIIRIQNLTGSSESFNYYEGEAEDRHTVREGDLLVSWAATLGVYVWRGPDAVLNQHIFKVDSYILPGFHRYLLDHALSDLQRQTHGSGMVHITKGKFNLTKVPLPPLAEQERILAAIEERLPRLDAAVAGTARGLDRARALAAQIIETLMVGIGEWTTLESYAAPGGITDGPFGSKLKSDHYTREGPRVIRLENIGIGEFVDERTHISAEYFKELRKHEVVAGDLVVASLVSERPRACVLPMDVGPAIVKADCIRVRLKEGSDARFLNYALMRPSLQNFVAENVRGVGRSRLGLTNVRRIPVPLASSKVQSHVAEDLGDKLAVLSRIDAQGWKIRHRAEALRRSLLSAALSGELVPQNPDDEPASVLLERIRAERGVATRTRRTRRAKGS